MFIFRTDAGNLGDPKRTGEKTVTCIAPTDVSTKIQHATVFTQHRSPKVPGIMGPRKSHLGVRGSPGSSPRAPHLPIPAPDSAGPGPEQSVRATKELCKAPRAGPHIRRRLAGAGVRGGPRGGSGEQYLPSLDWASPRPGERALVVPQAWALDKRKNLKAGPLPPRLAPAPGWLCRIKEVLASPSG